MRVYKRGKYWWIDYTYQGRRYRYSLKTRSKKLAQLYMQDLELKIFKREKLGIHEERIPFHYLADIYLDYIKVNGTARTYEVEKYKNKTLKQFFEGYTIQEITPEMIERFKTELSAKVSQQTVNRYLTTLRAMFNKAIQWGYLKDSPMNKVEFFREPPGRLRFLNPEEIQKLIDSSPEHLRPIIIVALNTGLRKSEILSLRWDQIDFVHNVITVIGKKTGERRIIPMNKTVKTTLMKLPRTSEYIFPGPKGKPIQSIKKSFKTACKKAGIENFRFHDLRHTFASYLVMAGVDLRTVAQLLGHKTLRMVMRYSHLSQDHLQKAVDRIGTIMAHQSPGDTFTMPNITGKISN